MVLSMTLVALMAAYKQTEANAKVAELERYCPLFDKQNNAERSVGK